MDYNILKATPEYDKYKDDGEWFKKFAHHVARQFDRQLYRDAGIGAANAGLISGAYTNIGDGYSSEAYPFGSPINAINVFYQYYTHRQENRSYAYAATDTDNAPLPSVWIRGQKVTELVDDLIGKMMKIVQFAEIDTKSVSPAATNRKTKQLEMATLFQDLKPQFEKMAQTGVEFSPLGGQEQMFESTTDINNYFKYNYKEKMEVDAHYIAKDIMTRNDFANFFKGTLKDCLIGGVIAVRPEVKEGKVWWKLYPGYQVIWDNKVDSEHHRTDRYRGIVEYMSPAEIITEFGDELQKTKKGREALEKLKEVTVSNYTGIPGILNSTINVAMANDYTVNIAVVRTWFRALKDTRYVADTNKDTGNKYVTKIKEKHNGSKNYWWETWYKCTLIADLAIVDYGEETNLVESFENKSVVEPPVVVWTPDMTMGHARSMVERLYQHQDTKDYYFNKMTQFADRSTGKNFIVYGEELGITDVTSIINDFKRYGITVLTKQKGDDEMADKNSKLTEQVDMTLDPNIPILMSLMKVEDEFMEKIASTSDISLGQQQRYISVNSQLSTIAQNEKGIYGLTISFIKHICQVLQLSTNMQKNLIAKYNDTYPLPMVSEAGQVFLNATKDLSLEDFMIYMRFQDNITAETRTRLLTIAERYASQTPPAISMKDVLYMETAQTLTELINYFDNIARKDEEKQAAIAQMEAEMAQAQQQAAAEEQLMQTAMKEQGQNQRAEAKNENDLLQTMVKTGSAPAA